MYYLWYWNIFMKSRNLEVLHTCMLEQGYNSNKMQDSRKSKIRCWFVSPGSKSLLSKVICNCYRVTCWFQAQPQNIVNLEVALSYLCMAAWMPHGNVPVLWSIICSKQNNIWYFKRHRGLVSISDQLKGPKTISYVRKS